MSVEVNSTRKAVEISWDPAGGVPEPEPPEGFPVYPAHPIFFPDATPEHPIELPESIWGPTDPRPDQGPVGDQPSVEHPIVIPPVIWGGNDPLPGYGLPEGDNNPIGNLPPSAQPVHDKALGVQIFAQGQDGDWSNTDVKLNDGLAVLSYPKDFTGESYVEVRALDGTLVDSGTIQVL